MKLLKIASLLIAGWFVPTALLAHNDLTQSSPADGSVLNVAPETIAMEFTGEVQLLRFVLTDSGNKVLATAFKPSADARKSFAVALPALEQDTYTASWAIMGSDGHLVEKTFSFTVDHTAEGSAGTAAEPHAAPGH